MRRKPCIFCRETPRLEKRLIPRNGMFWAEGDRLVYSLECSCGRGSAGVNKGEVIRMWNEQADDLELARESREAKEADGSG